MSSGNPDRATRLMRKARDARHDLTARLLLAAAVQAVADGVRARAIVVGGTALDYHVAEVAGHSPTYPEKWRPSRDLDVVAVTVKGDDAQRALKEALRDALGFQPNVLGEDASGRVMYGRDVEVPDFRYPIEIVSGDAGPGTSTERVVTLEVEGQDVYLWSPEDTLLAYAESGWHLRDRRDWERAIAVARVYRDELDREYLERRARERGMPRALETALRVEPLPEGAGRLE